MKHNETNTINKIWNIYGWDVVWRIRITACASIMFEKTNNSRREKWRGLFVAVSFLT
jgi:hypothetical protein